MQSSTRFLKTRMVNTKLLRPSIKLRLRSLLDQSRLFDAFPDTTRHLFAPRISFSCIPGPGWAHLPQIKGAFCEHQGSNEGASFGSGLSCCAGLVWFGCVVLLTSEIGSDSPGTVSSENTIIKNDLRKTPTTKIGAVPNGSFLKTLQMWAPQMQWDTFYF